MRTSLTFLTAVLVIGSSPALAQGPSVVLDETGYWRHYVQFGIDRMDPAALKAEGDNPGAPGLGKSIAQLERRVKKLYEPSFSSVDSLRLCGIVKPDWEKQDWRDNALVWFQTTQWGTGERASFYNFSPTPPPQWSGLDFDDSAWMRQRVGLLMGNMRRERTTWDDHDMQQLEVRAGFFRGSFEVENPAAGYTVNLTYRGGARVFLNGKEIGRGHLPAGEVTAETRSQPYPQEAYIRLADEAPKGLSEAVVARYGIDYCADLTGTWDEGLAPAKPGEERYWRINIGWGDELVNRKGWNRITGLRNRTLALKLPPELLKKGTNMLAVEVRTADLHPIVAACRDGNWGRGYFLHAQFTWGHCRLLGAQLGCADAKAPSSLKRPAGVQVWVEDMHRRCFEGDFAPGGRNAPLKLVGSANGSFSGQIVVGTDKELPGLKVACGDLAGPDGAKIPASAFKLGYLQAHPATTLVKLGQIMCYPTMVSDPLKCSAAEVAMARYGDKSVKIVARTADPAMTTKDLPPEQQKYLDAMAKVRYFDDIADAAPATVPADTCQPIWVWLNVPADVQAGMYKGAITVSAQGMPPVSVPVEAQILPWQVPAPKDFQTVVALDQSPYAVARQYDVPPWSDRHFKLLEPSLAQLGRIGNNWLLVPVINNTEFGNGDDSLIRWVKSSDEKMAFDFKFLDRYLDLAIKHMGSPRVICFVIMHGAGREGGAALADVTLYDQAGNKTGTLDVSSKSPNYRKSWQSFATALLSHMRSRGQEKSVHWGFGWDTWGEATMLPLMAEFAPSVGWVQSSHPGGANKQVPVVFSVTTGELSEADSHGWMNAVCNLLNPRAGNNTMSSNGNSPPFTFRIMTDRALVTGKNGIGRIGGDYWKDTYFFGSKNYVAGGAAGMPCLMLLWPGPNGAQPSPRFEALREGVQEAEARIFIEQAIQRGKLPAELVAKAHKVLFEHNRATLYISAGRVGGQIHEYCHGWQERSAELFAVAGEVASAVGFDVVAAQQPVEVPARGKAQLVLRLRNWSSTPRPWKAVADQPWIVPSAGEGTAVGWQSLNVTIDASSLAPEKSVEGKLTVTDITSGASYAVPVKATVSKIFELAMPRTFDFAKRQLYGEPTPTGPMGVFNAAVGAPDSREFTLFNFTGSPLPFEAQTSAAWVSVSPASGTVESGGSLLLKVTASPTPEIASQSVSTPVALTVKETAGGLSQEGKLLVHILSPYQAPVMPKGNSAPLEHLMIKSHKGYTGDGGGPVFKVREAKLPDGAMLAVPEQETVFDLDKAGVTGFSANVGVETLEQDSRRFGMDKMKVNFEIHVDGHIRIQSGLMTADDKPRLLAVENLASAKELKLVTRFDVPEGRNDPRTWMTLLLRTRWDNTLVYGEPAALAALPAPMPFVKTLNIAGPFAGIAKGHAPESQPAALDAKFTEGQKQLAWKEWSSKGFMFSLAEPLGLKTPVAADQVVYALAYAHCTEPVKGHLELWHFAGAEAWVNGQQVLEDRPKAELTVSFSRAPIELKKGANPILLKLPVQPWREWFSMRIRAARADCDKVAVKAGP